MIKELLLLTIIAVATCNIAVYLLTGTWPIFTWITMIQQLPAALSNLWNQAQTYGISPLQAIGAVASVGAGATALIAKLKQRLTTQKQQAQVELNATKTAALQAQDQLTKDYRTLEGKFTAETQKVQELEAKLQNAVPKEEYDHMQQQYQHDFNILRQATDPNYVKACEDTLREHNIPLPERQGNTIIRTLVK